MKKFLAFGKWFVKKPTGKESQGNRLLSKEEIEANRQIAEEKSKSDAQKRARSARKGKPVNRINRPTDSNEPSPSNRGFKLFKRTKTNAKQSPKKSQSIAVIFRDIISGEFLTRDGVTRHIPYLLFISLLFILYISMGYQFERIEREKYNTKKQLEELSAEFKTLKAEFETQLQQSNVEEKIAELGLHQTVEPPFLLEANVDKP